MRWVSFPQVILGKLQKPKPVESFDGMAAFPEMVTYVGLDDGLANRGRRLYFQAFLSEQAIDGARVVSAQVFASRVGPLILDGAGDIERPRRDAGQEHVLIDRQIILIV